jgi:hypothetical protein
MTVSRQFAHIMIHVLGKWVRVHHVVAWVPDGAQRVDILLLPFCMWFSMVSPMMHQSIILRPILLVRIIYSQQVRTHTHTHTHMHPSFNAFLIVGQNTSGGALATLASPDAETDPLFQVHDDNAWKSRGVPAPPPPSTEVQSNQESGEREEGGEEGGGRERQLTYNPTAGREEGGGERWGDGRRELRSCWGQVNVG